MEIRNYTSSVPVERSVQQIMQLLTEFGAKKVAHFYTDGVISGFFFELYDEGRALTFRLPANPEGVYQVLLMRIKRPTPATEERVREQSQRTAWRLLYEWVHIQLTMVRLRQAESTEVFLPYLYDGKHERTFYSILKEGKFKQLSQPLESAHE